VSTLYFVEHNKQQQADGFFGAGMFRQEAGPTHLSDEERHYFHNLHTLFKNKTHGPWPMRQMYATSTSRPPGSRQAEEEAEDLAAVLTKPQVRAPGACQHWPKQPATACQGSA